MSADGATIKTCTRLVPVPEHLRKLIPQNVETEHELWFLEVNGRTPALAGLSEFLKKDRQDVDKLIKNLRLQLGSKKIVTNPQKVQTGKGSKQREIIEIKANRGHSRLFAFFSSDGRLIICTHTYWKTSGSTKQQNREFERAAEMRLLYLAGTKEGNIKNDC